MELGQLFVDDFESGDTVVMMVELEWDGKIAKNIKFLEEVDRFKTPTDDDEEQKN